MGAMTHSKTWRNWAGEQACHPLRVHRPASRARLRELVAAAAAAGEKVLVPGSGHSFSEAALTEGVMIDVSRIAGVIEADRSSGLVRVGAGTVLADLNRELDKLGLAMANLGDIDRQTIAGAISTGTHGTGIGLGNLSSQVAGMEVVLPDGSVRALSDEREGDGGELRAARVGLGALGAISTVTLRTVPAFHLHRIDEPRPLDEVLDSFEDLAGANDHFEFFVFPYTRKALTIRRNRTRRPPRPRGRAARWLGDVVLENGVGDLALRATRAHPAAIPRFTGVAAGLMAQGEQIDSSFRIFANHREIRFTEMEHSLPLETGPEAVDRVLRLIEEERFEVAMPIECRVVAPDDSYLSPSYGRTSFYVAVHQYRGMEFGPYFEAVEELLRSLGGRPHWGKRNSRAAQDLEPAYPKWRAFQEVRDSWDPGRVFTNRYVARVLGA